MKKRLLSLLLAAGMLLTLAACGSKTPAPSNSNAPSASGSTGGDVT